MAALTAERAAVLADLIPANDGQGYHCFIIRLPPWLDEQVEEFRRAMSKATGKKVAGADACRILLDRATKDRARRARRRGLLRKARAAQLPLLGDPRK